MNEKQNQKVGDNSTAIQVNGDYHAGLPYDQVKSIFMDLFELNFPRIQTIAKTEADKRVQDLLNVLRQSMEAKQSNIDVSKFTDPGIQFEMQQLITSVARRGNKSNIDLLSELFTTIIEKDCPEIIELIAGETLKILPLLGVKQLDVLSVMILTFEASVEIKTIEQAENVFRDAMPFIRQAEYITSGDISYLECVNCISRKSITHVNVVPNIIRCIPGMEKTGIEEVISQSKQKQLSNILSFTKYMEKCQIGRFDLSPVGRLIGWLHIQRISKIDIKTLF
jgi:hypothetical protein